MKTTLEHRSCLKVECGGCGGLVWFGPRATFLALDGDTDRRCFECGASNDLRELIAMSRRQLELQHDD